MVRGGKPTIFAHLDLPRLVKPYSLDRSGTHGFSSTSATRDKPYRAYPLSTRNRCFLRANLQKSSPAASPVAEDNCQPTSYNAGLSVNWHQPVF